MGRIGTTETGKEDAPFHGNSLTPNEALQNLFTPEAAVEESDAEAGAGVAPAAAAAVRPDQPHRFHVRKADTMGLSRCFTRNLKSPN